MTTRKPKPGIRRRRHEAACEALEKHGWTQVGHRHGETQVYRHVKETARRLMVGAGGAIYWTRGRDATIERHAHRRDGADVTAGLDAARRTV